MRARDLMRLCVVGLAAVHVAGLLGAVPVPWTGTLATMVLMVYVWSAAEGGPAGWATRLGFAALVLAAVCVDVRSFGVGWPGALAGGPGPVLRLSDGLLVVAGLAAIAIAPVLRRRRVPGLVAVVLVALFAGPPLVALAFPPQESALSAVQGGSHSEYGSLLTPGLRLEAGVQVSTAYRTTPGLPWERSHLPWERSRPTEVPDSAVQLLDFDVWSWRFSWAEIAPAVPAMLLFAGLAAIAGAAGRSREESAAARPL